MTVTWPLSVRASRGSIEPSDDVKVTTVPFCTGVPADSMTTAVISAVPLVGSTVTLGDQADRAVGGRQQRHLVAAGGGEAAARSGRDGRRKDR